MDDLVTRLSQANTVTATRIRESPKMLKESIDRHYVHLTFDETGTELGFKLDRTNCKFEKADFESGRGSIHIEGGLILNYMKVRVVADVDLASLKGLGFLKPVPDSEYSTMMTENKN
jgi:hypothetical protein